VVVVEDVGNCKRFENRCKFIQAPTHVTLLIDVQHFSPGSLPSYLHHLPHCRVPLPQYLMKQRQPWDLRSYWLENDLGPGTSPSPLSYLTPYWDPLWKQLSVSSLWRYGNGPHPHYHDHNGDRFTTTTAHSTNHDDDGIPSVQCKLSLRFLLSLTPHPLSVPCPDRLASSPPEFGRLMYKVSTVIVSGLLIIARQLSSHLFYRSLSYSGHYPTIPLL